MRFPSSKCVFGQGFAPDPTVGAYSTPLTAGGEGLIGPGLSPKPHTLLSALRALSFQISALTLTFNRLV